MQDMYKYNNNILKKAGKEKDDVSTSDSLVNPLIFNRHFDIDIKHAALKGETQRDTVIYSAYIIIATIHFALFFSKY